MLNWINWRVVVVVVSVLATLNVTMADTPQESATRAIIVCSVMFLGYLLAFLVPLRKAVRFGSLLGMAVVLVVAWGATGLALIIDKLAQAQVENSHSWNWPMTAFALAAGVAFYLFFDNASKGRTALEEMNATGRSPLDDYDEDAISLDSGWDVKVPKVKARGGNKG